MGLKAAALRGPKASQAFCSSHGQGAGVWAAGLAFDLQEPGAEPRVRVPFSQPLAHGSLEQAEAPLSSPGKLRPREGKGLAQGCPESGAEPGGECGLQGPRPGLLTSPVPWRGCKPAGLLLFPPEQFSYDNKLRNVPDTCCPFAGSWEGGRRGGSGAWAWEEGSRSIRQQREASFNFGPRPQLGEQIRRRRVGARPPARSYGCRGGFTETEQAHAAPPSQPIPLRVHGTPSPSTWAYWTPGDRCPHAQRGREEGRWCEDHRPCSVLTLPPQGHTAEPTCTGDTGFHVPFSCWDPAGPSLSA